MNEQKARLKSLLYKATTYAQRIQRYSLLGFLLFVALIYGFILLRINTLANQQPSDLEVTSQVKAARIPHIDQGVLNQLQSLQDNSVNVKTLFNQARSNPFQ